MRTIIRCITASILLVQNAMTAFVLSPQLARDPNAAGLSPFLLTSDIGSSLRYQQVYDSSDFGALGMGPFLITEISFGAHPASAPIDVNLPNIQINFATTARNPDGLSTTFGENVGANDMVVHSGPLHFVNTGTEMYGIHVLLQSPFIYDPTAGNLLLDVRNFAAIPPPSAGSYLIWGEVTFGDSISTISSDNVFAVNGFPVTGGYVTRFTVTPIPEPGTLALICVGVLVTVCIRAKRFRRIFSSMQASERGRD